MNIFVKQFYTLVKIEDFWINNLALEGELSKSHDSSSWHGSTWIPFKRDLIWECQLVSRLHLHLSWASARGICNRRVKRVFPAALSLYCLPQVPLSQAFFVLFLHPCKYSSKKGQGSIELSLILFLKYTVKCCRPESNTWDGLIIPTYTNRNDHINWWLKLGPAGILRRINTFQRY